MLNDYASIGISSLKSVNYIQKMSMESLNGSTKNESV
jgi:hypothetical protein